MGHQMGQLHHRHRHNQPDIHPHSHRTQPLHPRHRRPSQHPRKQTTAPSNPPPHTPTPTSPTPDLDHNPNHKVNWQQPPPTAGAAQNIRVEPNVTLGLSVWWDAADDIPTGKTVNGYYVEYRAPGETAWTRVQHPSGGNLVDQLLASTTRSLHQPPRHRYEGRNRHSLP